MTEKQLIGIQDGLFETSRTRLLEVGHTYQVGFLITGLGCEDGALEGGKFSLMPLSSTGEMPEDGNGYSIMMIDMQPNDEVLLHQFIHNMPHTLEQIKKAIAVGMTVFGFTEEEAYTHTLNTILDINKADRKDIVAWMIRQLCEKSKAFAFIHNSEGYSVETDSPEERKKYEKVLEEDPRSKEVLFSNMECYGFNRHIKVFINREPAPPGGRRDSGKILSFSEVDVIYDKECRGKGRFMDLLAPVD